MKNTTSQIFSKVSASYTSNRRPVNYIIMVTLLLIPFQNCGKLSPSAAGTDTSTPASLNPIGNGGTGGGTEVPSQDQIDRAACSANEAVPTFASVSPTMVNMTSGLSAISGDKASEAVTAVANKNVVDPTIETKHNCARFRVLSVQCAIASDAAHLPVVTTGIGMDGSDQAVGATTTNQKRDVMDRAINQGGCANQAIATNGQITFTLANDRQGNNFVRCASGTVHMELKIRSMVDNKTLESAMKYVRLGVTDGCWGESRVKDQVNTAQTDFPKLAGAGTDVSIDGNWAAITAPNQALGTTFNAGAIHIYNFANAKWNYHSRIQLSDARIDDTISSVVVKGDTLVLGSTYRNDSGGVLIYKLANNVWGKVSEITPPRAQAGQLFGYSLAFDGANLFIGAPHYSRSGSDRAGAVYHFGVDAAGGATLAATLEWSGPDFSDRGFGMKLALDGSLLAVGAPQAITRESLGMGAVVLYQNNAGTWTSTAVKAAPTGLSATMGLRFGAALALGGGRLIVGAPGHDAGGGNTNSGGAAYYATAASATATKVFVSNEKDGVWGTSVALGSGGVFVGGPYRNGRAGFVDYYLTGNLNTASYRMVNWNQTSNDAFGWALSVSGNRVFVGARIKNDPLQSSGAAYIYEMK
ncbi:MAG: FG-GAP repeat protein [Bdellovibrionales bacterium]|nr:FG-GAP repeat protein [Bdellovibrionales bacterium]